MEEIILMQGICNPITKRGVVKNGKGVLTNERFIFFKHSLAKTLTIGILVNFTSGDFEYEIPLSEIESYSVEKYRLGHALVITTKSGTTYKYGIAKHLEWELGFKNAINANLDSAKLSAPPVSEPQEQTENASPKATPEPQKATLEPPKAIPEPAKAAPRNFTPSPQAQAVAKKVHNIEVGTGIAWIILGIIQLCFVYTAIAGVWNIVNAIISLRSASNIQAGNEAVIQYFEKRKTTLIIFTVINVLLGAALGIFLVAFDWYNRDYALKNRSAFSIDAEIPAEEFSPANVQEPAVAVGAASSTNFCANCGSKAIGLKHFCTNCGAKL